MFKLNNTLIKNSGLFSVIPICFTFYLYKTLKIQILTEVKQIDILKEITDDPKKYHGFTKTGVLKEDLTIKAGKKRTRTFVVFDMLTESEPIGSGENKIWHCSGDEWILQSMKNSGVKKGDTITVWGSLCICRDSIVYAPYFDFNIMLRAWKFADKERDKLRIPIEEGSPNYTEYILST